MFFTSETIEVESFVRYCTDKTVGRNSQDWTAYDIVQIIKGRSFNGYFYYKIGSLNRRINSEGSSVCLDDILEKCAGKISELCPSGATIVPVPSSDGTKDNSNFRTIQLARQIDASLPNKFDAYPLLVWSEPQNRANKGERSRDWREHLPLLRMNGVAQRPIVLFDDVITSGSQMYACKRKLEEAGLKVVCMIAVASVLEKDGETHSDDPSWQTVSRTL